MKVDNSNITNILTLNNKAIQKIMTADILVKNDAKSILPNANNLIDELFDGLLNGSKNSLQIENGLKNLHFFKSLGSFSKNLEELARILGNKNSPEISELISKLSQKIDGFDDVKLQEFFKKSGVFLESKLLKNENASDDIKAILLTSNGKYGDETDRQIQKLLLQIDYYQLLSITSNSNWIYLPLGWDEFENGRIGIKKKKDKSFFCEIDLSLKTFGDVKIKLFNQDEQSLDLVFETNSDDFLEKAKVFAKELKLALSQIGFLTYINFHKPEQKIFQVFDTDDFSQEEIDIHV